MPESLRLDLAVSPLSLLSRAIAGSVVMAFFWVRAAILSLFSRVEQMNGLTQSGGNRLHAPLRSE